MERTKEILMNQLERLEELAEHVEDVIVGYKMQVELAGAMAQLADRVIACNSLGLAAAAGDPSVACGDTSPCRGGKCAAAQTGIEACRKAIGMDQQELADRLGVSRSTVAMWDRSR